MSDSLKAELTREHRKHRETLDMLRTCLLYLATISDNEFVDSQLMGDEDVDIAAALRHTLTNQIRLKE